jgi:hypothetical protein
VIEGVPSMIFVEASYSIETVEAERISVDQIARILPGAGGSAHASQRASPVPRRRTPQPSLARNRLTVVLPTQALPSGGWRTLSDAALLVPKSTLRGTPQGASLGRPPNESLRRCQMCIASQPNESLRRCQMCIASQPNESLRRCQMCIASQPSAGSCSAKCFAARDSRCAGSGRQ